MQPNMILIVIAAMLLAVHFSSISSEEVTHMPHVKDVELAPEVIEALKGEKLDKPECYEEYRADIGYVIKLLNKCMKHELRMRKLTICDSCDSIINEPMTVNRTTYAVYRLYEYSTVVEVWMRYPTIFAKCSECLLTNDQGEKHSGGMSIVWKNPVIRVVGQFIVFSDLRALGKPSDELVRKRLANGTNVNKDTVDVTCQGDDVFNQVCKKAHEDGELDSVMHAVAEHIFNFDEEHFPDLAYGIRLNLQLRASNAFVCDIRELGTKYF